MTHAYVTWLIHIWHDSFIWNMTYSYVTWLIHMWHDLFIWDMTHSYVTWLIHMWRDLFICDVTHSYGTWLLPTWHDSSIRDTSNTHSKSPGFSKYEGFTIAMMISSLVGAKSTVSRAAEATWIHIYHNSFISHIHLTLMKEVFALLAVYLPNWMPLSAKLNGSFRQIEWLFPQVPIREIFLSLGSYSIDGL